MKPLFSVIIFGLALFPILGTSGSSSLSDPPAILTVAASEKGQVVTFDAAFVSGDSTASGPLKYDHYKTPFRVEIPSPYFFGIFKKVSGDADIIVVVHTLGAVARASSSTILITKSGRTIKTEGF